MRPDHEIGTLQTSVISPVRDSLCPNVFEDHKMKPDVRKDLLYWAGSVIEQLGLDVKYVWVIGSILTYQHEDDSDIDVNIAVQGLRGQSAVDQVNKEIGRQFNGRRFVAGHPVNFHILGRALSRRNFDAAFDLVTGHWIKKPTKVEQAEIDALVKQCGSSNLLAELLEEYALLRHAVSLTVTGDGAQAKDVVRHMERFVSVFKSIHDARRGFGKGNSKLPFNSSCSNVVYKIAESYGFKKLYRLFKDALEE